MKMVLRHRHAWVWCSLLASKFVEHNEHVFIDGWGMDERHLEAMEMRRV